MVAGTRPIGEWHLSYLIESMSGGNSYLEGSYCRNAIRGKRMIQEDGDRLNGGGFCVDGQGRDCKRHMRREIKRGV